jgi:hypothetical protein
MTKTELLADITRECQNLRAEIEERLSYLRDKVGWV